MTGAYLQRLYDRAAAAPAALALPGGPSGSPVAAADQRLNDPGFAEMFSFAPAPADMDLDAENGFTAAIPPTPRPRREPTSPEAPAMDAVPAPDEDRLRPPPAANVPRPAMPAPPPPMPAAPSILRPIGEVVADDFVPPESAEPRATGPLPNAEPPPPVAAPASRQIESTDPVSPPHMAAPPSPAAPAVQAEPPTDRAWPIEAAPTLVEAPAPPEPRPDVAPVETDRPQPRLVEPPQPRMAPPPEPEPRDVPPPPNEPRQAKPEPTVREVVREEMATRQAPAPRRPMTAAEASLIGPLAAEPRARTLFGLRRR